MVQALPGTRFPSTECVTRRLNCHIAPTVPVPLAAATIEMNADVTCRVESADTDPAVPNSDDGARDHDRMSPAACRASPVEFEVRAGLIDVSAPRRHKHVAAAERPTTFTEHLA